MSDQLYAYLALLAGASLIIYVCFVTYKVAREKRQIHKKTHTLLQQEAQKYFYGICKPFLHTILPDHPLPTSYVTVIIAGDLMSVYATRHIRARKSLHRLKCKKTEAKLFEARYCIKPKSVETHVFRKGISIAESTYLLQDFESVIVRFLSHEYAIDPFASPKK